MTTADLRRKLPSMSTAHRAAVLAQMQPDAPKVRRGMNKTEAAFAAELEAWKLNGVVKWFEFESVRLHLGGGAYFRPDFPTVMQDGSMTFFETKGFMREAAKVRLRVAAGKFPHWRFVVVNREGGTWNYEEIRP